MASGLVRSFLIWLLIISADLQAAELRLAVAANFKTTIDKIVKDFEQQTPHKVSVIVASSGTLFSQISHGAPYDLFLSADSERPQRLVRENLALADSLFTYALGQLVFWAPKNYSPQQQSVESYILSQKGKLAIANPRLAPYGQSAYQYIKRNALLPQLKSKIIRGNNVVQTFQFVESGNAQSGIVSYAQLINAGVTNHFSLLPAAQYPKIVQQGVILKNSKNIALARQLIAFIKHQSKATILKAGYLIESPDVS
jgi:molybdate transport system substrate-binding protein